MRQCKWDYVYNNGSIMGLVMIKWGSLNIIYIYKWWLVMIKWCFCLLYRLHIYIYTYIYPRYYG